MDTTAEIEQNVGGVRDVPASAGRAAGTKPIEHWRREISQIKTSLDQRRFLEALRHLPPEESAEVVLRLYPDLDDPRHRQLLHRFLTRDSLHPKAFVLLVRIARATDGSARFSALRALGELVLLDLAEDPRQLDDWVAATRDLDAAGAWRESARRFVARLRVKPFDEIREELKHRPLPGVGRGFQDARVPDVLREEQLPQLVMGWIESGRLDKQEMLAAHSWILMSRPDCEFVRQHYLPIIENIGSQSEDSVRIACSALGRPDNRWAVEALVLAYVASESRWKKWDVSLALDQIVGAPWVDWVRERQQSFGPEIRRLKLPQRHPWEYER